MPLTDDDVQGYVWREGVPLSGPYLMPGTTLRVPQWRDLPQGITYIALTDPFKRLLVEMATARGVTLAFDEPQLCLPPTLEGVTQLLAALERLGTLTGVGYDPAMECWPILVKAVELLETQARKEQP